MHFSNARFEKADGHLVFDIPFSPEKVLDESDAAVNADRIAVEEEIHALRGTPPLIRIELIEGAACLVRFADDLIGLLLRRNAVNFHDLLCAEFLRREDEDVEESVVIPEDVARTAADEDRGFLVRRTACKLHDTIHKKS